MMRCCLLFLVLLASCASPQETGEPRSDDRIQFITVDPGHFHAALVQKFMYDGVDPAVSVYAPAGNDLELHLERISDFNTRNENPTNWQLEVYRGDDFFNRMITEKKGNTVVLAGNNQKKTDYILKSIEEGLHVYADKPMAIDSEGFIKLKKAFETAEEEHRILYDIMTERFEITTILQKELSQSPDIFGTLQNGSPDNPAVTKESVHHFFKQVAGKPLIRPPWFFDVDQEGEGLVDVMTHLVDLVQWECFPETALDYSQDVQIVSSKRWPTPLSLEQFKEVTASNELPDFLKPRMQGDSGIQVFCNGEINFRLKDVYAKTSVSWAYQAPEGAGDTHYSIMRGTKCNLIIRQGEAENYKPVLYLERVTQDPEYEAHLSASFQEIANKYPGIRLEKENTNWRVEIPEVYHNGHEAHFAQVTEKFIEYFQEGTLPEWEVAYMLNKYFITTTALQRATSSNNQVLK